MLQCVGGHRNLSEVLWGVLRKSDKQGLMSKRKKEENIVALFPLGFMFLADGQGGTEYLLITILHECGDNFLASAGEHVDDWNLGHGVAAWLQTEGGASHVDQYLSSESRVVDAHVELETLVLSLARNALANEVHTMAHVLDIID